MDETRLERIRRIIGSVWGATTTIALAVGMAVLGYAVENPDKIPPEWTGKLFYVGIGVAVLRAITAPKQ